MKVLAAREKSRDSIEKCSDTLQVLRLRPSLREVVARVCVILRGDLLIV